MDEDEQFSGITKTAPVCISGFPNKCFFKVRKRVTDKRSMKYT